MKLEDIAIGKRVLIKSLGTKGTIDYIDLPTLYIDHYNPIQILLDEPTDDGALGMVWRTNIKDLKPVKKGRRKR